MDNLEYKVSDKKIHRSSIISSTAEKEPTLKSKSSFGSTLKKTSLHVQRPVGYRCKTSVN